MVEITEVLPGTLGEKHGILPGDKLVSVNNNAIRDVLDYRFYLSEKSVSLKLFRGEDEYTVLIRKGEYEDIGLSFATPLMDAKMRCKNGCIFCFIDQNPKGMRESIYFKDDDSRLSFLHGNYITLTNMTDGDVERIVKMRFSPVNVSVHTTNPDLRVKMMKNKRAGEVLKYLGVLKDAGISMCGQIVLCRGVNDGAELDRSLSDLAKLYPEMGSVSVVPAGITAHRAGLYPLSDFSPCEAAAVIEQVEAFGRKCEQTLGCRLFYLADEWYLKAGQPLPSADFYDGYPQIENGVGMLRSFSDDFDFAMEDTLAPTLPRKVTVVTGVAAAGTLSELAKKAEVAYPGLTVQVVTVKNHYFGESITVAGLLTGKDIAEQIANLDLGDELLLPRACLKADEDLFLCGMTLDEFKRKAGVSVRVTENDGYAFLYALLGLCEE